MSVQNRPYVGTWVSNRKAIIQWTPDALVYLNGDTSLPGCQTCHHSINIQEFINSISVDFGVEPGASNCSISMAVPRHYGDSVFRDGNTLMRPGLEVHVYFRGYFPMKGMNTPNAQPIAGINLSDIPQYPYYPAFHGVVTQVSHEYSGGFYTVSMTCAGMLHFWEHQKLSGASGGSFFGARPANSGIQTTLTGHPMTGKTPYGIIYSLYRDTAGVADGVGFALSSRTNYGAVNSTTNDPLYAMTLRYWEQRFRGRIYGLRMHGASGQMFTSSQQAYLSLYRTNSFGGRSGTGNVSSSTAHPSDDIFAQDPALLLGLRARGPDGRILRQVDTRLLASESGGRMGLDVSQLQAFPTDIGSYGQVNLWESTYESKMDVATAVTNVSGYEFYQDADGDLVFKPPLFNLDTSSSRVYRIEPEDIVSISFTEAEPSATYVVVKGGAFQNMRGLVDESEWGCRSTYVDYKLVAQFGWIEASVESTYYTNARSAFYFAINHLDRTNAGVNGCSVTIPMRAEIRPGYPVYIPHIDCFYYVTSVSHAYNVGSECTTTLTLTARRRKFLPPGESSSTNVSLDQNLSQIDLSKTANPVRPLQALDNSGVPRLVGFPNVVMAIDPLAVNPMFSVIGYQAVERELRGTGRDGSVTAADTSRRSSFVWSFVQMMLSRNPAVLRPVSQNTTGDTLAPQQTEDFLAQNPGQRFEVVGLSGTSGPVTVTIESLQQALEAYITNRAVLKRAKAILIHRLVDQQNSINAAQAAAQTANQTAQGRSRQTGETSPPEVTADLTAQNLRAKAIQAQIDEFDRNFDAVPPTRTPSEYTAQYNTLAGVVNQIDTATVEQGGPGPSTGRQANRTPRQTAGHINTDTSNRGRQETVLMSYLIGQFRTAGPESGDVRHDPSGTINTSANLLEQLSDRKASLNLTVPGHYRYYSASHPNPVMQGYLDVDRTVTEGASGSTTVTEGTITSAGRVTGQVQRVPARETHLTGEQAAGYIIRAWRTLNHGQSPPTGVAEVLVSQWALETGRGRNMLNYNFGGIKAVRAGLRTRYGTTEGSTGEGNLRNARSWFQAYGNADEGARHFVRQIASGQHREALAQYIRVLGGAASIDNSLFTGGGTQAAGEAYARQLRRTHYYTGDIEDYARNVAGLANGIARQWVQNASTSDTAPTDPVSNPGTPPTSSTVPESEISTTVVRPASNLDGVPEERRGNYVEVVPKHIPTKGLRVRTVESTSPRVVPTNLIFAMTFEARGRRVLTRVPVVGFNPTQPRALKQFIVTCLTGTPTALGAFLNALTGAFAQAVGTAELSLCRTTEAEIAALITLATANITDLRNAQGLIGGEASRQVAANLALGGLRDDSPIRNITDGRPNTRNPSSVQDIRVDNEVKARMVLQSKAAALISDIAVANGVQLNRAIAMLDDLGVHGRITPEITTLIDPWLQSLTKLFRGTPLPAFGPFQVSSAIRLQESNSDEYSPVYPVSDALGYEHYGSFQYGRGLSIEPGGNYERLMATDPLQYVTDTQREQFLRALHSPVEGRGTRVRESLASIANDPAFQNTPGAHAALDYLENEQRNGDRTTMIANGLANYIMSDRDAVMKLPVNNVAFRMADLSPMGEQDTCACRGAEADLLLAAYMAGTEAFATIGTEDEAANWVASQMEQASVAWSDTQSKMRGMAMDQGRRSLLDSVEGWEGIAGQFRSTNENAATGLTTGVANSAAALAQQT